MSAVAEPMMTEGGREAEKQDAVMQVAKLTILIDQLEDDAKRDPEIAAEVEDLRSRRSVTEARLRDLLEVDRRERQAAEAARTESEELRRSHLAQARRLGAERVVAAKKVDETFRQAALAVSGYHRICGEQQNALIGAGLRSAADMGRPHGGRVLAALRAALHEARVSVAAIDGLGPVSRQHVRRLADADPIPVAPAEPSDG